MVSKRALLVLWMVLIAAGLLAPALTLAQGGVTVTPNREYINVRLWPAIGADVIGSMEPGDVATATGRSIDGDWLRIDYQGREGWVAVLVVHVGGDVNSLPLADPRTIPYNSNTVPNAGGGSLAGPLRGTLNESGLYLRSGPSVAYPILANLPRYAIVSVTGRAEDARWVQVSWEDLVGWVALRYLTLEGPGDGTTVYSLPVVGPAADTGVRLNDANARDRFLVVDEIRRYLDRANATWTVIDEAWYSFTVAGRPEICSAPPPLEDFHLIAYERHVFPDLAETVDRFNQGLNDLRNTIQWWLDGCVPGYGGFTEDVIVQGRIAVATARLAFDEVQFRITRSRAVMITAIHAHINYAQDQFERIEAIWLSVRAGVVGEPPCINPPQQPPDFALTSWEASAYPDLVPLVARLNQGLAVLRQSIELWANECDRYNTIPGYIMPPENSAAGYNAMLETRTILNEVRDVYLINAYESGGFVVPAPTPTPNLTIQAILHPPYTPTFTLTPTPSFSFEHSQAFLVPSAIYAPCAWFGVAGQVLGPDGNPLPGVIVHLVGGGQDVLVLSGSNPRYGPAGWEVPLRLDAAQLNPYTVRIEDADGNPLSADLTIRFTDDCTLNTALVTFMQFR